MALQAEVSFACPIFSTQLRRRTRLLLCLSLASSCITADPEFKESQSTATQGSTPDPSTSGHQVDQVEPSFDRESSQGNSSTRTHSASESSTGTESAELSDSEVDTELDATESASTDSTGSTGNTDDDTQDMDIPIHVPLTVENPATDPIVSNLPLTLSIDHSHMVSLGAAEDGSDLRIVYHPGLSTQQIMPVQLDHDSSWNQIDTQLWFKAWAYLGGGDTDTSTYHLVYRADAEFPVPVGTVFAISSDFSSAQLDPPKWNIVVEGTASAVIADGQLHLQAEGGRPDTAKVEIHSLARSQRDAMVLEARSWVGEDTLDAACASALVVGASSSPADTVRTALGLSTSRHSHLQTENGMLVQARDRPGADGEWHHYAIHWIGQDVHFYRDREFMYSSLAAVEYPTGASGWTQLMVGLHINSTGCTGTVAVETKIDWMQLRAALMPEPRVYPSTRGPGQMTNDE